MDATDFCDLDKEDPSTKLSFDLYENLNHEATQQSGSLKSYGAKEQDSAIYDRRKSGHRVTVERLLWVDGFEHSTVDGEKSTTEQEMTLVVLKIVLAPQEPGTKFWYMKASLTFQDMEKSGINEPQVQAWAPYKNLEIWNKTVAHHTKSGKKEGSLEVGHSAASATGSWSSESEVSWDRKFHNEGRSNATLSQKTLKRTGVTWVVDQNNLEKAGIPQELWVAVLLSRPTAEPYLATFEIDARVGTVEDFRNKTRRFFGFGPDNTVLFKVTPRVKEVCCYEGKDIKKCIDVNNLGALRSSDDSSMLDMKLGPKYQVEAYQVEAYQVEAKALERPGNSWATTDVSKDSQSKTSPVSEENIAQTATPAEEPAISVAAETIKPLPQVNLPPLVVGWHSPGTMANMDSNRLMGLEECMARLEARLHEQDSTIIALQQKLLEKGRGGRS
ncbi:hypothetical protein TsFJ059_008203 [Trichoderma semiorbis]|uniref:Uncharacterized protein n=1 Tax=Trichoderma semiorbis TaxID=1491008 RepID=A0A9P8HEF8_9HYPO|nr:hypothetical protein TsFJ059_008203 [Trichoderma semiorbis]